MTIRPMKKTQVSIIQVSIIGACLMIMMGMGVAISIAQPVKNRIFEDASVQRGDQGGFTFTLHFSFPVRYLRHFPEQQGNLLQIALQAISISAIDKILLRHRESLRVPEPLKDIVSDVSYEGDLPGGHYLTLRFSGPARFEVHQGKDFRSITITLSGMGDGLQ